MEKDLCPLKGTSAFVLSSRPSHMATSAARESGKWRLFRGTVPLLQTGPLSLHRDGVRKNHLKPLSDSGVPGLSCMLLLGSFCVDIPRSASVCSSGRTQGFPFYLIYSKEREIKRVSV